MRFKVTLFLLFANAVLFAGLFFFHREWRVDEAARAGRLRVFGPEAGSLNALTIESAGGTLKLERSGEDWSIVSPLKWPANGFAVRRILNELQFLEHDTQFSLNDVEKSGQSLGDYGLADPRLTLTFSSDTAKHPVTVFLGQDTAVGNRLYLLVKGTEQVHVVSRDLADVLAQSLATLRSDALFTIPPFEARSVTIQANGGGRVRLQRGQNAWMLEAPVLDRADETAVGHLLNGLSSLRVINFLADTDPKAAHYRESLARPAYRVTLEGNHRRETLLIGPAESGADKAADGAKGALYIVQLEDREPLCVVEISPVLGGYFANAQTALRDHHVWNFDADQVTSINLSSPARPELGELTLQRLDDQSWQTLQRNTDAAPAPLPADTEAVKGLISRLQSLKATEFASDAPSEAQLESFGLKLPQRVVTLSMRQAADAPAPVSALTLNLALSGGSHPVAYARQEGKTFVYKVPTEALAQIPLSARAYRERLLQNLPDSTRITQITLRSADDSKVLYTHTLAENETWGKALADEPEARRKPLQVLLAQLRHLQAERIVQENFPASVTVNGEQRPWAWRLDYTLAGAQNADTPETGSLFIAERGGGGTQLIGSPRLNLVFNASSELIDALWSLLYGDRDPGAPAAAGEEAPAATTKAPAAAAPAPTADAGTPATSANDGGSAATAVKPAPSVMAPDAAPTAAH